MITSRGCRLRRIARYLKQHMNVDELLDFLFHLDTCERCREQLYRAVKASHPEYYKGVGALEETLEEVA